MVDSPAPAVYRVNELVTLLCMGERQVREALIRGEIPCHKIGSRWRCSRVAIHRWLDGEEGRSNGLEVAQQHPETSNEAGFTSPSLVMASR